jgi:integrase
MAAKLEKTRTPGVFKRGSRYAVLYRDASGRQRQESARTFDEARNLRTRRAAAVSDGSHQPQTRERFGDFAPAWADRYQGNGRRGFTEDTRREYRRDLERFAVPVLGRMKLEQITPRDVAHLVAWLCDEKAQGQRVAEERRARLAADRGVPESTLPLGELDKATRRHIIDPVHLADSTVRRILAPLRACLRTATAEGLIRHNPTIGAALPARDEQRRISLGEDDIGDDQDVQALTEAQLAMLLAVAPARHRLLFELIAGTGVRISEAIALRWGDVELDGDRPVVRVRRAYVKGRFKPPKSRYGKRAIPVDFEMVRKLRQALGDTEWPGKRDLVFPGAAGKPLNYSNLHKRVMKPTAEEAGVPWAAFHTLRHTCATRLFADGRNAVQVQRWLGHHSPAFTLNTYVHLMDGDLGGPLGAPQSASEVSAAPTDATRNDRQPATLEAA